MAEWRRMRNVSQTGGVDSFATRSEAEHVAQRYKSAYKWDVRVRGIRGGRYVLEVNR